MDRQVLLKAIKNFQFGYCFIIERANIGERMLSSRDKYTIHSFVLVTELNIYDFYIHLICSDNAYIGEGQLLLNEVIKYAKEIGIAGIQLHALLDRKLIDWYRKILFNDNSIKVYEMYKNLNINP